MTDIQTLLDRAFANSWYGRFKEGEEPMPRCPACGAQLKMRNGVGICYYCDPDRWHMNVHDIDEIEEKEE